MDPRAIVETLTGLPIWSAVVGPAGQYVLSIELGEQLRRPVRLSNPRLSFVKRTFEGTHTLLIECPWRLEDARGILASAFECFEKDAIIGEHPRLSNERVARAEVDLRTGDLALELSEGLILRAIALEARAQRPERANWTLTGPEQVLSSGPMGRLLVRSRAEAEGAFKRMLRAHEEEDAPIPRRPRPLDDDPEP